MFPGLRWTRVLFLEHHNKHINREWLGAVKVNEFHSPYLWWICRDWRNDTGIYWFLSKWSITFGAQCQNWFSRQHRSLGAGRFPSMVLSCASSKSSVRNRLLIRNVNGRESICIIPWVWSKSTLTVVQPSGPSNQKGVRKEFVKSFIKLLSCLVFNWILIEKLNDRSWPSFKLRVARRWPSKHRSNLSSQWWCTLRERWTSETANRSTKSPTILMFGPSTQIFLQMPEISNVYSCQFCGYYIPYDKCAKLLWMIKSSELWISTEFWISRIANKNIWRKRTHGCALSDHHEGLLNSENVTSGEIYGSPNCCSAGR